MNPRWQLREVRPTVWVLFHDGSPVALSDCPWTLLLTPAGVG